MQYFRVQRRSLALNMALGLLLLEGLACSAAYRDMGQPVRPLPNGMILCEAEEFRVKTPGWRPLAWGENLYAATFANTFLSRKAALTAPADCLETMADLDIEVTVPGQYLALIRYESVFRFETHFQLQIEQNGKILLDHHYGIRDNLRIWPFGRKLAVEAPWPWGAVENIVWEGHNVFVNLDTGRATLRLIARDQPSPAACRTVDAILLTTNAVEIARRIDTEAYLPLDGLLTQAGDLFLRLRNHSDGSAITLTIPPGNEHSPYWVHQRQWTPITLSALAGSASLWMEVGQLLDSLNDGQWLLSATSSVPNPTFHYTLELAVAEANGNLTPLRAFEFRSPKAELAYFADTRYSRKISTPAEVLSNLMAGLAADKLPGDGPRRTLIYGIAPEPIRELFHLAGSRAIRRPAGYIDLRDKDPAQVESYCRSLQATGQDKDIAIVNTGHGATLPQPAANDHAGFRAWLASQKLTPEDLLHGAGMSWDLIHYQAGASTNDARRYFYSRRYEHAYGIRSQKQLTDRLRQYFTNAIIGANFASREPPYCLGQVHQWVTLFREEGMTMPWSEDYAWCLPVGSPQMSQLNLDLCRAGLRGKAAMPIHCSVMPHWPGNTPAAWRRQFFADLAHGMQVVNLNEFRPLQLAYSEHYVNSPDMFRAIRRALWDLARFEDIVQDGAVRAGLVALWFSETGDIWNDSHDPFAAGKRTLYIAIRHQQLPLDCVTEEDARAGRLASYKVLYLTDGHVSVAATRSIESWVQQGGILFATAGAGWWDEFHQPNHDLRRLLGVRPQFQETPRADNIVFEKQDLPYAKPIDTVTWSNRDESVRIPVIAARDVCAAREAEVVGRYGKGGAAILRHTVGAGSTWYCGFLPGLSYFKPALPARPVDRGATDASMAHFIPTDFDPGAGQLVAAPALQITRPVVSSDPSVEWGIIESTNGMAIPLVRWAPDPVKNLEIQLTFKTPFQQVSRASGLPVNARRAGATLVLTLDLDTADALIFR